MNKMTIIGNLTRDPELRTVGQDRVSVCSMTVAVRKRHPRQGGPDADFVNVTAWRSLGESCAAYLQKGSKVGVVGAAEAKCWQRQDGSSVAYIEISAEDVEFCDRRGTATTQAPAEAQAAEAPSGDIVVEDDELPF